MDAPADAISFAPLQAADLPMLREWLRRPHVSEWWGGDEDLRGYIALLQGRPTGFIQCYEVMGAGDGWWEGETDPGARVTKVQTDPSPDNRRAIRSYVRAGFIPRGEVMTPGGPALLMLRQRLP